MREYDQRNLSLSRDAGSLVRQINGIIDAVLAANNAAPAVDAMDLERTLFAEDEDGLRSTDRPAAAPNLNAIAPSLPILERIVPLVDPSISDAQAKRPRRSDQSADSSVSEDLFSSSDEEERESRDADDFELKNGHSTGDLSSGEEEESSFGSSRRSHRSSQRDRDRQRKRDSRSHRLAPSSPRRERRDRSDRRDVVQRKSRSLLIHIFRYKNPLTILTSSFLGSIVLFMRIHLRTHCYGEPDVRWAALMAQQTVQVQWKTNLRKSPRKLGKLPY